MTSKHQSSVVQYKLHPDFTLTNVNCSNDPIHRPIAIQSNGHILVIDITAAPTLHAISAQLPAYLGHASGSVWSKPIEQWLPSALLKVVTRGYSSDYTTQSLPDTILLSDIAFGITHHQHAGMLIIEFEPKADAQIDDLSIHAAAKAFRASDDNESLYTQASQRMAMAFEFDRVAIYKFDNDYHSSVIGEFKTEGMEPFLGHHFPESDIPEAARDLFLLNRFQAITDVGMPNETLLFNPKLGENPPRLDLSYSQLWATSPNHIQYLKNMDVCASLIFAIVINGNLWGLLACYHSTPRRVLFNDKTTGAIIVDLLAKRILELAVERDYLKSKATHAIEKSLLAHVTLGEDYSIQVTKSALLINDLCEADGAALITLNKCIYTSGQIPSNTELIAIRDWLVIEGYDEVFSTNNFAVDIPVLVDKAWPVGGMLSSCICELSDSYLLWFRQPVSRVVNWKGDSDNNYSIESEKSIQNIPISPRQSFIKWRTQTDGQSLRWKINELDMADRVRQGFLKKVLVYSAKLIERSNIEFMHLTYAAVHDLQEPLRTQSNYLQLLQESIDSGDYDDLRHFANVTENAASRMSDLVNDLLTFSRLGSTALRENVNLTQTIEIIRGELESTLNKTQTKLSVGELPTIVGDSRRILQLMRNLITNAIKYVEIGTVPEISIYTEKNGAYWTLNIKDNGIGIDPKYHSSIFTMFKRLHGKNEYSGSGIGLAICAKVVDLMGAELGIQSEEGAGSIFWIRFHTSRIVK